MLKKKHFNVSVVKRTSTSFLLKELFVVACEALFGT